MGKKEHVSETPATAFLKKHGVHFSEHVYAYEEHGGTRKRLPVYVEKSVLGLARIYVNGGRRGYLVGIDPAELLRLLDAKTVEVALEG
jgi:prolyl-tRNA editing enzyme YbaK/EbsC (Cys-tRNA(Pro) deacylase)